MSLSLEQRITARHAEYVLADRKSKRLILAHEVCDLVSENQIKPLAHNNYLDFEGKYDPEERLVDYLSREEKTGCMACALGAFFVAHTLASDGPDHTLREMRLIDSIDMVEILSEAFEPRDLALMEMAFESRRTLSYLCKRFNVTQEEVNDAYYWSRQYQKASKRLIALCQLLVDQDGELAFLPGYESTTEENQS